jgi:peptidoglycan hydrolase-like protein with peptidoglycan-binding domain
MAFANLKRGSKGDNVKKVQTWLVDNGYDIGKTGVDGVLGQKTESAIRKAQGDNEWKVDGIVGPETWGGMFNAPKETTEVAPVSQNVKQNQSNVDTSKSGADIITQEITSKQPSASVYNPQQDEAYMQALAILKQVQNTAPAYKDSFSGQLQDLYNQIVNREKFSYDVNSDALYQQYKDQYVQQGKMAMQDTMGQAAALTGGYGSSYAQGVGQQAYQGYLQQLNDRVPELYDRALAQYNQKGQDMLNQYAMLGDMADDEYMKYRDSMSDYYNKLDMARQDVDTAYNRGYQSNRDAIDDSRYDYEVQHALDREAIEDQRYDEQWDYQKEQDMLDRDYQDRVFDYTKEQDAIANQQWQDSFDYNKEQDSLNRADNNEAKAYNKVISFIGTEYNPTDSELSAAGLTREQYDAIGKAATSVESSSFGDMSGKEFAELLLGATTMEEAEAVVIAAGGTAEAWDAFGRIWHSKSNDLPTTPPSDFKLGYSRYTQDEIKGAWSALLNNDRQKFNGYFASQSQADKMWEKFRPSN